MLDTIPIETITMLASGLGGFIMKSMATKRELDQQRFDNTLLALSARGDHEVKTADAAANRVTTDFGKWTRRIIALSIIFAVIGLCYISGFVDSPNFVETTKGGGSFLFGLFETANKTEFIELNGFVQKDVLWLFAGHVVSFYLGSGAAKGK